MKALARVGIVGLAVLGFAVLPAPTEALVCTGENSALEWTGTLNEWAAEAVECGDKIYTYISSTLAGRADQNDAVTIDTGDGQTYQLAIAFAPDLGGGTNLTLNYSIAVAALSPDFITSIDLDQTQNCSNILVGGECRVEKDIFVDEAGTFAGTLTSVNGVPDAMLVNTKLVRIEERFSVNCTGDPACNINGVQNTITQIPREVPLPGTLVMLGLGLAGAGLWRYRKGA
jgi:hypothetical protein